MNTAIFVLQDGHKWCGRSVLTIIAFCLIVPGIMNAQDPSTEFWPEIDLWYRLSPAWRLSMYLPLSKNIDTKYREGAILFQGDYAWGRSRFLDNRRLLDEDKARQMRVNLSRAGYLTAKSLGDNGEAYQENMVFFEEHYRTPLRGHLLISHRLRGDLRWIGDDDAFSYRVRYRFMLEREWVMKNVSLVPYINIEPYYDSRYETINRTRYIGGASVSWTPRIAIEGNFTYQHDTHSSVTDLYAVNIILHVFFQTKHANRS